MNIRQWRSSAVGRPRASLAGGLLVAVLAAATAVGLGQVRSAAAGLGAYSAAISPAATVPNLSQSYTLTITNQSPPSSATLLGSADITVPVAFQVSSVGITAPMGWTATLAGQVIELRASSPAASLLPGQSVTSTAVATAAATSFGFYAWTTAADVSDTFTDPVPLFAYSGSAQPTVRVGNQASVVVCPAGQSCDSGTLTTSRSSVNVLANAGPTNDVLTTAIGGLPRMSCTRSGDVARFTVDHRTKDIVYTLSGEYEVGLQICYGSAQPFQQANRTAAPFVNGEYEGLLPRCASAGAAGPCVQAQTEDEATDTLSTTIVAPPGDPATSGH